MSEIVIKHLNSNIDFIAFVHSRCLIVMNAFSIPGCIRI